MRALVVFTIVAALGAVGCGEGDERSGPAEREPRAGERRAQDPKARQRPGRSAMGVKAFLERGARTKRASVRGRLVPIGRHHLIISGEGVAAMAVAPPSFVRGLRPRGVPVVVTGPVRRLERRQAERIADRLGRARRAAQRRPARRRAIESARGRAGEPYLLVEQVSPAPRNPRRLRSLDRLDRPRG